MNASGPRFFDDVHALVKTVPRGRVVTYGQVAALLGVPRGARAVGWAMRASGGRLPWHRVVGAAGRISLAGTPGGIEQVRRLRREGVRFISGRVDMARHGLWARDSAVAQTTLSRRRRAAGGASRAPAGGAAA